VAFSREVTVNGLFAAPRRHTSVIAGGCAAAAPRPALPVYVYKYSGVDFCRAVRERRGLALAFPL
jgi:hypothetical protein